MQIWDYRLLCLYKKVLLLPLHQVRMSTETYLAVTAENWSDITKDDSSFLL